MEKVEIATRFLRTRREVLFLRRQAFGQAFGSERRGRLRTLEVELETLAWVLGVDLELMNAPKKLELLRAPEQVEVTHLAAYDCYLVEFPANPDPGFKTEYWCSFISSAHLRELRDAIDHALGVVVSAPEGSSAPPVEARVVMLDRSRVVSFDRASLSSPDVVELPPSLPPQGA